MLFSGGVNRVFLVGKIADEPVWQVVQGQRVLCFQLITAEPYRKGNSKLTHQEFHHIKIPPGLVEGDILIQKDQLVYIQGKIQTRVVFEDDVKQYKAEILALNIQQVDVNSQPAFAGWDDDADTFR